MNLTRSIVVPAALVFVAYIGSVLVVDWLLTLGMGRQLLTDTLAFSIVQFIAIGGLVIVLLTRKIRFQAQRARADQWEPEVRAALSEHVAESNRMPQLKELHRAYPEILESCLLEMLVMTRGQGRRTLEFLARTFGYASRWHKDATSRWAWKRRPAIAALVALGGAEAQRSFEAALSDPEPDIRLMVARAMSASDATTAGHVFRFAFAEPPLVRALLAEDLKRHASVLTAEVLPQLRNHTELAAALEMAASWRRSLSIPGLAEYCASPYAEVATYGLRLLAYCGDPAEQEAIVLKALQHPSAAVRSLAGELSGQLQMTQCLDALSSGLHDRDASAARACAWALARIGPDAWKILEAEVTSGGASANTAMEALELAQTGRLEAVGS